MLTGDLIAGARHLVGLRTPEDLARAAGIPVATVIRAEEALDVVPPWMDMHDMVKIIDALAERGADFFLEPGQSAVIWSVRWVPGKPAKLRPRLAVAGVATTH